MFYHYSGAGNAPDLSNTSRAINATMLISDQLMTWGDGSHHQPVHILPDKSIPNGQYCFIISDWKVVVEKIGTFYGSSGYIYLEFHSPGIGDMQWRFVSDANNYQYDWNGQISGIEQPNDWVSPLAPDYGHLPSKLKKCACEFGAPAGIGKLFNAGNTTPIISFNRVLWPVAPVINVVDIK
jgi:hypothetical protein